MNMDDEQQKGHESCLVEELELAVPNSFKLENAVCNHGFFMMAPNRWIPKIKTLHRPLRLSNSTSITLSISQSSPNSLSIPVYSNNHLFRLNSDDKHSILIQVKRMLRLSRKQETSVNEFQKLHAIAKTRGFGRLFRAPTLFEDIVKCILLCNTRFSRTLLMAKRLCKAQPLVIRGAFETADLDVMEMGNFPNVEEIINLGVEVLTKTCRLGDRARTIFQFAKRVKEGKIKLEHEEEEGFTRELRKNLMKIKGVGPFVCESVMMCIGDYNGVPQDTETNRHLREVHGKGRGTKLTKTEIRDLYEPYKPFQCLAFWSEMVESYESVFGKLSELPESKYGNVGGNGIAYKRGQLQS